MTARKTDQATCRRAEAFVRHAGRWVSSKELSEFIGTNVETAGMALSYAVAHGVIQRRHKHGGSGGSLLEWRLAELQPEPAIKLVNTDWPPGFVSQFDKVVVPSYEARVK